MTNNAAQGWTFPLCQTKIKFDHCLRASVLLVPSRATRLYWMLRVHEKNSEMFGLFASY